MEIKNKKKFIGAVIILVFFMILFIIGYFVSRPKQVSTDDIFVEKPSSTQKSSKSDSDTIQVCISGEVKKPGLYSFNEGSRVKDVIDKAGGFLQDADYSRVNLAKKLKDEDQIIIDKINQNVQTNNVTGSSNTDEKINVNTATLEQLDSVKGIGTVTAKKIIDYRQKNGNFKSIEDLKKVGRIGDKTIEKLKDKIDVR